MDDKTLQALTALADKLGTTSEYLFGILVKQAPISGMLNLLVLTAWVLACVWLVWLTKRKTTVEPGKYEAEWNNAIWLAVGTIAFLTMLVAGCGLIDSISALLNPEYWALKQILN